MRLNTAIAKLWALKSTQTVALQGFPSWYEFPQETATAGSIIGYSVPPSFAAQLFAQIQQ
ncbi:DNA cytosine methyltransferase [Nostoc sp. PCC 9305]|uniref:DNA cytosine methyltransferase n=1 Tax=Nostoc sp. PCC 9305 TaxID=296636 RepID=UPI0039C62F69